MFISPTVAHETDHALTMLDLASLDNVKQAMRIEAGRAHGYFGATRLDSAFQPIYSLAHRRIVGHEGLLRATNIEGTNIPPMQLFNEGRGHVSNAQSVFLDRLCRTIHLHNYQVEQINNQWLFLNVSEQVVNRRWDHGPFFVELMASYDASPKCVVVEIVEGVIPDFKLLNEAVKFYRDAGCLVAIDDFGAEASDIERIWSVGPDIVKLDRKIIAAAEFNDKARRVLRATVALIHEAGSLALLEGVENSEQAIIALDSNADLVQGFYFAMPTAKPIQQGDGGIAKLADMHPDVRHDGVQYQSLQPYTMEFKCVLLRLANGQLLESACAPLIAMPRIDRCYVIDASGHQVGAPLVAHRNSINSAISRFAPLEDSSGANWSRKPYHYRAITQPGELQVSRPYLSVASSRLCVTLSATFQVGGQLRVLCCDIEWRENNG
ncbi:MAG TPA: EAL domain-containing protein [Methylotenera sp.]|nr:EAL domain-containing protein [Methylotenera sp.]